MGLFNSIISAIGSGWNDVFGGGGGDDEQQKKKQQNTPITNNNINPGARISMPQNFSSSPSISQPKPTTPTLSLGPSNNANLAPAPVHPQPQPQAHPSFWSSLLHGAANDAKLVGQTGEALVNAVPEVGLAAGRVVTGIGEGALQIPHIVSAGAATGTKALADSGLPGAGTVNDVAQGINTGTKDATNFVSKPLNYASRGLDIAAKKYNELSPGPENIGIGEKVYKETQVPLNVLAAALTLGSSAGAEGAEGASQAGNVVTRALNKPLTSNTDNVVSKAAQTVQRYTKPTIDIATRPISSINSAIRGTTPEEPIPIDKSPSEAELPLESPESGIKPVEKPTPAPTSEAPEPTPTATPPAPESGVKPTPSPAPKPVAPIEPTPAPVTPTPAPTTPAVQAAENAAQEAVTKTAETPPAPVAAPTAEAVTPPTKAASEAAVAAPAQQITNEAPNINKLLTPTGDTKKDLENVATLLKHNIENGRNYGDSADLQDLLARVNGHQLGNKMVADKLYGALSDAVGPQRFAAIENALQTGTVDALSAEDKAVAQLLQSHLFQPSDVLRAATDKDYVPVKNYSPQFRTDTVRSAAKTAAGAKTLTGKVNSFNDLLAKSRLSGARTMGKFTDSTGKTLVGDPADLGLVAKKDGTYVDKAGKSYSYSGATNEELRNAGVNLHDLGNSARIAAHDAQNLKVRAAAAQEILKNPEKYNLSETATHNNQPSVILKDADGNSHELFTDKKTQKALQQSGVVPGYGENNNIALTALRGLNSAVVQSIVLNPFVHGTNQLVQAMLAGGLRKNGISGLSLLKGDVSDANLYRFHEAGGYVPTYGKDSGGIISQMTHGVSKINQRVMSGIDGNFRVRAFDSLTKGGMTDKEAVQAVNRFMGDRNTLSNATKNMTIFWHYFMTLNKSAKSALVETAHGHPGALANAGIAAAAWYGLNKAWDDATGNPDASVHAPGVVGLGKQYVKGAEDLASGQFKKAILGTFGNRVHPVVSEPVEQLMNEDAFTGGKIDTGKGDGFTQRVEHAASQTPMTNFFNPNKQSIPEKVGNTFGLYEPHIKGDMAVAPDSPLKFINQKDAQDGSTIAFPKDYTGEQSAKAVNDFLDTTGTKYSAKTAAQFNSQSPVDQKALTAATKTLRTVGVTNMADVQKFARLSSGDQQSYVDAVKALNQAGTTVDSSSVERHLVDNGKVELAAQLNKNIPDNLTQDDKNALERFATSGNSDQRKVWLQNNDNAASYYSAELNRKAATGALTNEDKDTSGTWSGTGNTLAVKALVAQTNKQFNVSQDLQQLYEDTTKTKYEHMSGPQKDALTQYAEQLNQNGVLDKFGLGDGSSSGSGGSKSAFKNRGLPSSGDAVVMPGHAAGLTAGTAKYNAPTLATASSSTSNKTNPFVRSISATKGVKV